MKRLVLVVFVLSVLFIGCSPITDITNTDQLNDVVLYDGVMDNTTNITFKQPDWGFPNDFITLKMEFSNPEVFDGTFILRTSTTSDAWNVSYYAPNFIIYYNVNLTNSLYFNIYSGNWENDEGWDGRSIDCKITWLR